MGSSKKQTVGYHYKYLLHYGICRGPVDAFLEFRGGDRTAWSGRVEESSTISINAPNLWGGEKSEGGIVGDVDLMFGEADQLPNGWLIANQGAEQSGYRGKFTFLFKGGRFGINPYPKTVSFKFRRILKGWDDDVCWYPETAVIGVTEPDSGVYVRAMESSGYRSPGGGVWEEPAPGTSTSWMVGIRGRFLSWNGAGGSTYTEDGNNWIAAGSMPGAGGSREGVVFKGDVVIAGSIANTVYSTDRGTTFIEWPASDEQANFLAATDTRMFTASHYHGNIMHSDSSSGPWVNGAAHGLTAGDLIAMAASPSVCMLGSSDVGDITQPMVVSTESGDSITIETLPTLAAGHVKGMAYGLGKFAGVTSAGEVFYKVGVTWNLSAFAADPLDGAIHSFRFVDGFFYLVQVGTTWQSTDLENWEVVAGLAGLTPFWIAGGTTIDTRTFGTYSMNAAHILIDSLTSKDMQGEPWDGIDEDSFIAAADRLYDETFGLITTFDHQRETVEQFQERILNVIGGSLSQSRIDGKYRLDLIRGNYVLEDLPILSDADILEFEREPSNPNDSVNEVVVEWFDPVKKEQRSTTPLQSLGAIQAAGAVISETQKYPEIPREDLALRVAARDLKSKSTPLNRFRLVTTRKPFGWRAGTFFRLQAPRRGIEDMVCMVGELSAGTLRSGAMTMVAVQDVTGMPSTTYVVPEPGIDTTPNQTPDPVPAQVLFESPFIELAGTLPAADRAILAEDAGFILGATTRPDTENNYGFFTRGPGEEYTDRGVSDWAPTGLVVEAATRDPAEINFTLSGAMDLSRVTVGTAALWGDELVRVDAIDITAPSATFGRGVGDTPPIDHAAGERVWFYDAWGATDQVEYSDGEDVAAKFITYTSTQELAIELAPVSTVTMASRQARPYAPGNVRIDASLFPAGPVANPIVLTLAHRDRILQADQLVDYTVASIGPEPDTEYVARYYDNATDDLLFESDPFTADSISTHEFTFTGIARLELSAVRDALESWRPAVVVFTYENGGELLLTEAGESLTTEDGESIQTEA